MNFPKFNSNTLREMLNLSERKETLLTEIKKLEEQFLSYLGLSSKATTQLAQVESKQVPKKVSLKTPKSSSKPSKGPKLPPLKKRILAALTEAGSEGITAADLAKKIKAKNGSIHSWFYNNMEKFPEIERVGQGHFRIKQKN